MKQSQVFCLFSFLLISTISFAQNKNYNYENRWGKKVLSESIDLQVTTVNTTIYSSKQSAGLAAVVGAAVPIVFEFAASNTTQILKDRFKKYANEFSAKTSEQKFYEAEGKANLPELTISRSIILDETTGEELASEIVLEPELSEDKTAFRYRIKSYQYNYAKVRVRRKYKRFDVNVDIALKYISLKNGKYEVKDLRTVNLLLPQIQADKMKNVRQTKGTSKWEKSRSEWIPFPPYPSFNIATKPAITITTTEKREFDVSVTNDPGKPKSKEQETVSKVDESKGTESTVYKDAVLYEVAVTVKEMNPFKIKAEKQKEYFEGIQFDDDGAMLGTLFQALLTEEDDDEESKD